MTIAEFSRIAERGTARQFVIVTSFRQTMEFVVKQLRAVSPDLAYIPSRNRVEWANGSTAVLGSGHSLETLYGLRIDGALVYRVMGDKLPPEAFDVLFSLRRHSTVRVWEAWS